MSLPFPTSFSETDHLGLSLSQSCYDLAFSLITCKSDAGWNSATSNADLISVSGTSYECNIEAVGLVIVHVGCHKHCLYRSQPISKIMYMPMLLSCQRNMHMIVCTIHRSTNMPPWRLPRTPDPIPLLITRISYSFL
jgi:hypothetical protein